jgi:hypothetical protein
VPVLFDASAVSSASGLQTGTLSQLWTQDVAGNCGLVAVICSNAGSATGVPSGTPTASIGGTGISYLGSVLMGNTSIGGFIAVFGGLGIPNGSAKTCTYSITNSGLNFANAFGMSFTYSGVLSIGTLQTAFGSAGLASVTVASAVGRLVWGALGQYQAGAYTGFTLTSRQSNGGSAPGYIAGDGAGSSSVVVSGTSTAGAFAAAGIELLPAPTLVVPNLKVTQAINRASRY